MRDIETIEQPITHEKFRAFFDGIGKDIEEVQKMNEKHNEAMRLYCFETRLVIADAVQRFKELCQEMDEK
jgi:hypothetical protein